MANRSGNPVLSVEAQKNVAVVLRGLGKQTEDLIWSQNRRAKDAETRKRQKKEEFREMKELYKVRTRKQLARARRGLARLIALGRSPMMQEFFSARQRYLDAGASRGFSDENWFCFFGLIVSMRYIHIHIYPDKIGIVFGPEAANGANICFPYDPSGHDRTLKEMISYSERKKALLRKEMLKPDDDEWIPVAVASQALVNCGDKKKFEGYLVAALKKGSRY